MKERVSKDVEKRYTVGRKIGTAITRNDMGVPQESNYGATICPSSPTSDIFPKQMKSIY